jgi:hypothetical protein
MSLLWSLILWFPRALLPNDAGEQCGGEKDRGAPIATAMACRRSLQRLLGELVTMLADVKKDDTHKGLPRLAAQK